MTDTLVGGHAHIKAISYQTDGIYVTHTPLSSVCNTSLSPESKTSTIKYKICVTYDMAHIDSALNKTGQWYVKI